MCHLHRARKLADCMLSLWPAGCTVRPPNTLGSFKHPQHRHAPPAPKSSTTLPILSQTLNVLAPQLSVTSVIGSIIARAPPEVLGTANIPRLNALPSINLSAVPIAVWGRTLSQIGGVDPVKLGIEPGTPPPPDYDAWLVGAIMQLMLWTLQTSPCHSVGAIRRNVACVLGGCWCGSMAATRP